MNDPEKALWEMLAGHARSMPERERLAYIVRLLWGSDYGWGKEIIGDVDCSGSVCFALYTMGYDIRITAHDIYHKLCSEVLGSPRPGDLIFFSEGEDSRIVHVAVFSDNEVLMNAARHFEDTRFEDEIEYRRQKGQEHMMIGALNWKAISQLAKEGQNSYSIDTELKPLFGVFGFDNLDIYTGRFLKNNPTTI
jgi:murein DD-endopeptidase